MKKLWLYISNIGIAIWNLVRAVFGRYRYHPEDGYLYNLWVVFDCLLNTLALGDPHETVSSRSAKAQGYEQAQDPPRYGWGCRVCAFLAAFQENHCAKALDRNVGSRAVDPDE